MLYRSIGFFDNNSSIGYKFQRFQSIMGVLQQKIYFLTAKTTLNNVYLTVTDSFGQVVILRSGGAVKLSNSKKNTGYVLELMLVAVFKKLVKLNVKYVILKVDFQTLKKKKVIMKVLQGFAVQVLCIQLVVSKAFNGVRCKKKRRI